MDLRKIKLGYLWSNLPATIEEGLPDTYSGHTYGMKQLAEERTYLRKLNNSNYWTEAIYYRGKKIPLSFLDWVPSVITRAKSIDEVFVEMKAAQLLADEYDKTHCFNCGVEKSNTDDVYGLCGHCNTNMEAE